MFTALHDLKRTSGRTKPRSGSVYILNQKMHGSEEITMTVAVLGHP
jgi:malate synthase